MQKILKEVLPICIHQVFYQNGTILIGLAVALRGNDRIKLPVFHGFYIRWLLKSICAHME